MTHSYAEQIIHSRRHLLAGGSLQKSQDAAEGGCGVLGFAANIPIAGQARAQRFAPDAQPRQRQGRRHCHGRA